MQCCQQQFQFTESGNPLYDLNDQVGSRFQGGHHVHPIHLFLNDKSQSVISSHEGPLALFSFRDS